MATAQELLIRILGDGSQFRGDLSEDQKEINKLVEKMDGIHDVLASVRVDDEESRTKVEELQHDLDSIRDRTARVDVNTREGREEITQIRADLAELRDRTVDIHVDDADAILAINNVRAELDSLTDRTVNVRTENSGNPEVGEGMGALGSLIMTALPLASPLAASAVGGIMALASAFTAASAGAVGFGAVAVPNIKSVMDATSNLKKAQQEYNLATNNKQREAALLKEKQAMQGLDSAQQDAVKSLQSFESFWSGFVKSFQEPVLNLFSGGLKTLQTILTDLKPTISAAASAFEGLLKSFQQSLGTPPVQAFFNYLAQDAGPTITTFGGIAGNVLKGVMSLLVDFGPLGQQMSGGLLQMSQGFAKWAENVGKSQGFKDFISYVQTNGPKIIDVIGNVAKSLGNILVAIAPVGAKLLDVVDSVSKFLNKFTEAHPKIVEVAAATVSSVGAFNLLKSGLTGALGSVNGLFKPFKELKSAITDTVDNIKGGIDGVKKFGAAFKDGGAINKFGKDVVSAGQKALEMGKKAALAAADVIKSFAKMVASGVSTAAKMIAQWTVMAAKSTANAVKVAASWTISTGQAMAKAAADMAVSAAQFVAKWVMMGVQAMIQAARVAAAWLVAMGPVGWIIAGVTALITAGVVAWMTNFFGFRDKMTAFWNFIKGHWKQLLMAILNPFGPLISAAIWAWQNNFFGFRDKITALWNAIKSIFTTGVSHAISTVSNMISSIGHFFASLPGQAMKWGENMIDGFIGGIKNMVGKVTGAVSGVINAAKKFIGFNSPAEEGEGRNIVIWGQNMIGGFIDGIQNAVPKLKAVMSNVIAPPKLAVSTRVGNMISGNTGYSGTSTNQNASGQTSNSYIQQGPLLHIENLSVRNNQDITKIQQMLFNAHEQVTRGMGKRL